MKLKSQHNDSLWFILRPDFGLIKPAPGLFASLVGYPLCKLSNEIYSQ